MSIMYKEQAEFYYNCFLKQSVATDVCWTWYHHKSITAVMNITELTLQIERWNKEGGMKCNPKNNREVSDGEGRTWYCLTVQVLDDKGELDCNNNPMNPFHLMKFGIMVSGYTYYFHEKEMRDEVCKCINNRKAFSSGNFVMAWNGKTFDLTQKYTCSACYEVFEDTNGLNKEGRCCSKCNKKIIKQLEKQRDELAIVISEKIAEEAAEKLISESDGSVESEKSKKSNSSQEKSKTREANKNRDAKKKEKEDFIKHAAECARILAQQEVKKLALKKAKAKSQKK